MPQRRDWREMGHLNKSLSGTASDAEFTTAMVGCPTVTVTLGSSTDGDFMYYYTHHIGDYLSHTAHLTLLEHGIYLRLLQTYYLLEKPLLPDEAPRLIAAKAPEEVEAVTRVLKEFFTETPQGYVQKRADEELEKYKAKSDKARESANARWGMRTHSDRNAMAMLTNNQYPITNNLPSTNTSSPLLISSIDNIVESENKENANAMRTHSDGIAPSLPAHSPPIAPLSFGKGGLEWAHRLRAREEAGETLSVAQKRNWREALKVKA